MNHKLGSLGLIAAVKSNRARTPRKKIARKPSGWECQDCIGYNNEVRACLNVDDCRFAQESRHSDGSLCALYVFTDGSVRNISRREKCAGLGSTAMSSNQNRDEVPMVDACGPVQTDEGAEYYVRAIRATNNTAEMQALIEAFFWLNSCVDHEELIIFSKVMVTVDSLYVKGIIDEKFVGRENRALAKCSVTCGKGLGKRRRGTWEIPLPMSSQTWVRVRKHSIDGGSEFSRWRTGRKTLLKQRCRVFNEKEHRVNKPFVSGGQAW